MYSGSGPIPKPLDECATCKSIVGSETQNWTANRKGDIVENCPPCFLGYKATSVRTFTTYVAENRQLFKFFQQLHYLSSRYREPDVLGILYDRHIYADKFSIEVQKSATAIPGIDGSICLH